MIRFYSSFIIAIMVMTILPGCVMLSMVGGGPADRADYLSASLRPADTNEKSPDDERSQAVQLMVGESLLQADLLRLHYDGTDYFIYMNMAVTRGKSVILAASTFKVAVLDSKALSIPLEEYSATAVYVDPAWRIDEDTRVKSEINLGKSATTVILRFASLEMNAFRVKWDTISGGTSIPCSFDVYIEHGL